MKPLTDADRERIDRKLIAIMDELFEIMDQLGVDRQITKKPAAPKQASPMEKWRG